MVDHRANPPKREAATAWGGGYNRIGRASFHLKKEPQQH
jgi:hypothetical protein